MKQLLTLLSVLLLWLDAAQPNIILVMPDDVGVGDYACLGNPALPLHRADSS